MAALIKGTHPRPRVALIGEFDSKTTQNLIGLFPTYWMGNSFNEIEEVVDPKELDLVVIGKKVIEAPTWLNQVYVICFSEDINYLPAPTPRFIIHTPKSASTEAYLLPELPLNFERLREIDLADIKSIKGWRIIELLYMAPGIPRSKHQDALTPLLKGALIIDPYSKMPFATIFKRDKSELGVAWFPNSCFRIFPWVELICTDWAKTDKERFPEFGDWTKNPQWMVSDEENLSKQIDALITQKEITIRRYDQQIGNVQEGLLRISAEANQGLRRLITSQGNELVDEVGLAFSTLGFKVTKMDELIPEGLPKLEDLRIDDPEIKDWQAIVEVRGYSKSGGKTDDLARLARFARHYEIETGKNPQKRICVVNGQIELSPSQRQKPFISSPEDVNEFREQDGIVIWSLDLFQVVKNIAEKDLQQVRKTVREAKGRWP